MTFGVDYAFYPHPTIAALNSAGAQFIGRYVSPLASNDTNGKNLIPTEFAALRGAGKSLILYAEQTAGRIAQGAAAGTPDVQHFDAVTKALGMSGAVMFACADYDAPESDQPRIHAYLDAMAAVIGRSRVGLYGGYWPVSRAFNAGKIAFAVQTYAWSLFTGTQPAHAVKWRVGTRDFLADDRAQVRQGPYVPVGGVQCDRLDSYAADFGQWPRPTAPPAPAEGVYATPGDLSSTLYVTAYSLALGWSTPTNAVPDHAPWYHYQVEDAAGGILVDDRVQANSVRLALSSRPSRWRIAVGKDDVLLNSPWSEWQAIR